MTGESYRCKSCLNHLLCSQDIAYYSDNRLPLTAYNNFYTSALSGNKCDK